MTFLAYVLWWMEGGIFGFIVIVVAVSWKDKNTENHRIVSLQASSWNFSLSSKNQAQWRSWLRHCVTRWKVAASIPDSVVILHLANSLKRGSLKLLEPSGPIQVCTGIAAPLVPRSRSTASGYPVARSRFTGTLPVQMNGTKCSRRTHAAVASFFSLILFYTLLSFFLSFL